MDFLWVLICSIPTVITILIVWLLSRFKPGESSLLQRALIMTWLGLGSFTGILGVRFGNKPQDSYNPWTIFKGFIVEIYFLLTIGAVVIATWWVIAVEIKDFGICKRIF